MKILYFFSKKYVKLAEQYRKEADLLKEKLLASLPLEDKIKFDSSVKEEYRNKGLKKAKRRAKSIRKIVSKI